MDALQNVPVATDLCVHKLPKYRVLWSSDQCDVVALVCFPCAHALRQASAELLAAEVNDEEAAH